MNKRDRKIALQKLEFIQKLTITEIRFEVLLVQLYKMGLLDPKEIVIRPSGLFHRAYRSEVVAGELYDPTKTTSELYAINISREGIYDMLPEALFHHSTGRTAYKDVDEMVAASQRQQEVEQENRLFFLPFEQFFSRYRIAIEEKEQKYFMGEENEFLEKVFPELRQYVEAEEDYARLLVLLPLANRIAGRLELMQQTFTLILEEPVEIEMASPAHLVTDQERAGIGEMILGHDAVLGDFVEIDAPLLEITIGPVKHPASYLSGAAKNKLLDFLISYFVPVEFEFETTILSPQTAFELGDKEIHLGLNTML